MATIQDYLNFGKAAGVYTPPKPVVQQTPAQQLNKVTNNAYNPVLAAATAASSKSSGGGGSSNSGGGGSVSPGDPTKMTQSQRQSLWDAAGHSGTAPVGYGGESSGGGGDPAADMQQEILDSFKKQNDAYTKGLSDYDKSNPFSFDDMLKKEAENAKGTISPYYDRLLSNYMTGISYLKGNTIQDEQRALTKLQGDYDSYTGQAKNLLTTTMRQVGQNYAGAGSYDSGARQRTQGEAAADTAYNLGNTERQYNFDTGAAQIQAHRVLDQQIPLAVTEQTQAFDTAKADDINAEKYQLANYDQAQHNYLRQQAGIAAVPAVGKYGTANTIPGLSSAETQQQLQSMLPGVQISSYGGASATPLLGYN